MLFGNNRMDVCMDLSSNCPPVQRFTIMFTIKVYGCCWVGLRHPESLWNPLTDKSPHLQIDLWNMDMEIATRVLAGG